MASSASRGGLRVNGRGRGLGQSLAQARFLMGVAVSGTGTVNEQGHLCFLLPTSHKLRMQR